MTHAPSIATTALTDKGNFIPTSDTGPQSSGATQMTFLSTIHEQLGEEIHAWAARERTTRPGVTMSMLMNALARALGLESERQLYRYISGETPLPAAKVVPTCRAIGSWKLLQSLNQDAGLVAEPKPDVGRLDGYDLVVELTRSLRESAEFAAAAAEAGDTVPSELIVKRLEKEGREAIQSIERLIAINRELVEQRAAVVRS